MISRWGHRLRQPGANGRLSRVFAFWLRAGCIAPELRLKTGWEDSFGHCPKLYEFEHRLKIIFSGLGSCRHKKAFALLRRYCRFPRWLFQTEKGLLLSPRQKPPEIPAPLKREESSSWRHFGLRPDVYLHRSQGLFLPERPPRCPLRPVLFQIPPGHRQTLLSFQPGLRLPECPALSIYSHIGCRREWHGKGPAPLRRLFFFPWGSWGVQ